MSNDLKKELNSNNLNNDKFTKQIIDTIQEDKDNLFYDLLNDPLRKNKFIDHLRHIIIIKDFTILDKYFDESKEREKIALFPIIDLEDLGLLIILFPTKKYRSTRRTFLLKTIQKAYDNMNKL